MAIREIAGWGGYPKLECEVVPINAAKDIGPALDPRGTIARGLGRSYGDPAILRPGSVLDLTGLDRFLSFDPTTATLVCQAGVSLAEILATFGPRGFLPAITPGTKHVTVGGCIANDVHGKAHHIDGCFSNCVDSFRMLLADGSLVTCSREENPEIFWATFGGLGLLGVIVDATLRLRPVETAYFKQRAIRVGDLDELLDAFERYDERYPYSVAWIDPRATGAQLGRGVLTVGDHAPRSSLPTALRADPLHAGAKRARLAVPFTLPDLTLNPLTLRVLNTLIGEVQARGGEYVHYEKFFYPLDVIDDWNRGYGPRGFTQYQLVVPIKDGARRIRPILETIVASGQMPFLNVLKKFGRAGDGHLSFPFEGYTFAIDFPITSGLPALCRELDAMVIDAGGRVYLGKDAFLHPESLERMYPRLGEWREIKARVDPGDLFRSHLSSRVGLTR